MHYSSGGLARRHRHATYADAILDRVARNARQTIDLKSLVDTDHNLRKRARQWAGSSRIEGLMISE
jgi:hypothetical protein